MSRYAAPRRLAEAHSFELSSIDGKAGPADALTSIAFSPPDDVYSMSHLAGPLQRQSTGALRPRERTAFVVGTAARFPHLSCRARRCTSIDAVQFAVTLQPLDPLLGAGQ